CNECKSVIATLHGPSARRTGVHTGRAEKARAMAGQEKDRLRDPSTNGEERKRPKRRLLQGPKKSQKVAGKGGKKDGDEQAANSLYLPRRYLDTRRRKHCRARRWRRGLSGRTRHVPRRLRTLAPARPPPCGKARE